MVRKARRREILRVVPRILSSVRDAPPTDVGTQIEALLDQSPEIKSVDTVSTTSSSSISSSSSAVIARPELSFAKEKAMAVGSVFPLVRTTHYTTGIQRWRKPRKGKSNWTPTCGYLVFGRVDVYTMDGGGDARYGQHIAKALLWCVVTKVLTPRTIEIVPYFARKPVIQLRQKDPYELPASVPARWYIPSHEEWLLKRTHDRGCFTVTMTQDYHMPSVDVDTLWTLEHSLGDVAAAKLVLEELVPGMHYSVVDIIMGYCGVEDISPEMFSEMLKSLTKRKKQTRKRKMSSEQPELSKRVATQKGKSFTYKV